MDTSAVSAFSNVDVEEDGKVTVSEDQGQNSMHEAVDFPDVFHETPKKPPPRPSTPKTDNRSAEKKMKSAAVADEVEPGVKDMPTEADPVAEMGTAATETSKASHIGTISADDTKNDEEISESSVAYPVRTQRTIITSLREGVQPGISNRRDFALVPSNVALLVIDIQEYLSAPTSVEDEASNAYFYQTSLPSTISNVAALLKQMRPQRDALEQGCEVIFTYLEALTPDCRDVSLDYKLSGPQLAQLPNLATCPAAFLPDVLPHPRDGKGDVLIPKTSCSVFMSTNLHYVLQNLHIEQLLVCGQLTDQCVESAVRDAADLGYFVTVVQDACAAQSESSHQKGLSGMKGFSRILSTEEVLEELRNPQAEQIIRSMPSISTVVEQQEMISSAAVSKEEAVIRPNVAVLSVVDYIPSVFSHPDTTLAMLRALQFAGVVFLRFMAVDAYNSIRCKAVPLDHLLQQGDGNVDHQVTIAQVCFAGLPSYADTVLEETGLDAKKVLTLRPDLGTLRILPYATKTAVVLGTAHEIGDKSVLSPLCTRGLLARVIETARDHGIAFNVGAELEFCLFDATSHTPVDQSVFGNSTTLNQQESFVADLYTQLRQQHIPVTQIHAESAPGQFEVVLEYQQDPMKLADHVVLTRETISAVAASHELRAVFLPKLSESQAGNGCHLHLSFRRIKDSTTSSQNAFPHAHLSNELSADGKSFLEGILRHLPALLAISMPTQNSFRRVGPGCWTGSQVGWAVEDKESPLRVCVDGATNTMSNVEFKVCDSTANLHLCLACILGCGLNGIIQKCTLRPSLGEATDSDNMLPSSLKDSLTCLQEDSFLSMDLLGPTLSRAYLAVRNAEAARAADMTLEEEVKEALQRS